MVIESRTIVGAAGAFAVVAGAIWLSLNATAPTHQTGSVQVQQMEERSWSVQVKDMDVASPANGVVKTAANR
jgi:hypothetical protein